MPIAIHRLDQILKMVGHIPADSETTAVQTAWISAAEIDAVLAAISVGDMVATATLDAIFQQAQDSGGTGVKAITYNNSGVAADEAEITQLTQGGTDESDTAVQLGFNVKKDMDIQGDFTHFRLLMTPAVAAVEFGAVVFAIAADAPDALVL